MVLDKEGNEIVLVDDTNCGFKNISNATAKKSKLVYSGYQLEQLTKIYTRVIVTRTEPGEHS